MWDLEWNSRCIGKVRLPLEATKGRRSRKGCASRFQWLSGDSGQVLPWMILLMFIFLGICALTVDVGRGLLIRRQLQASADAAALAAALTLPDASYSTVGQAYSGFAGAKNAYYGYTVATPSITTRCSTTVAGPPWNIPCTSTSPNVVTVTESATYSTFFAGVLGMPRMTVNVMSTASKGAKPQPYNVAIILDTTPSMNTYDSHCGATQLQCASQAVQTLLNDLAPTQDYVSLFTFPSMTTTTVGQDYDCSSSNPSTGPYTFPSNTATSLSTMPWTTTTTSRHGHTTTTTQQMTYQVTYNQGSDKSGYLNDYRTSDTSKSLSTSSVLSKAVGANSGCTGIQTTSENTYFAATIYAAQASLFAAQAAHSGTQNAMIFLSDGNATAKLNDSGVSWGTDMVTGSMSTTVADNSGNYPSYVGQCGQGVDAAKYATNSGTRVFTISYGASTQSSASSGYCASDVNAGNHPNITPCQTMQLMSTGWPTNTANFYSDYYAPGGDAGCQAAGPAAVIANLNDIAAAIVGSLSGARLIPNGTI
jgi:Flp pilus assembly protein TadG